MTGKLTITVTLEPDGLLGVTSDVDCDAPPTALGAACGVAVVEAMQILRMVARQYADAGDGASALAVLDAAEKAAGYGFAAPDAADVTCVFGGVRGR